MSNSTATRTPEELAVVQSDIVAALQRGENEPQIVARLTEEGWNAGEAQTFVSVIQQAHAADQLVNVQAQRNNRERAAALHNLKVGGIWLAIGTVITGVTYANANQGGGHYTIMYGAILVGGFRFLSGLMGYLKTNRS